MHIRKWACAALVVCAQALSQTTSSRISGSITDPQGAAVPAAAVSILNPVTGQTFSTTTNAQGDYVVPSVPAATYRITVTAKGFRTTVLNDIKVDAAVPATVNAKLEVGTLTETVEVSAAAEVIQSTSATVSSTLVGRQLVELPTTTRNLLELVLTQPGTQTPGTPRTSSINGLPKGSVNISIDGLNVQDNLLRSDDGFFTTVMPRTDAIEEVTISTAGAGAESAGEGAAQVKFVTKSGTNSYHGGAVWQNRNNFFNANYYFNTIDRLPRDVINLNQTGVNLGGPFKKNKAFFFVNYEDFRLPQTYRVTAVMPNQEVLDGIFTYQDTATKQIRKINLFDLARAKNPTLPATVRPYATSADPMVLDIMNSYLKLTAPLAGSLQDRISGSNEYNRKDLNFLTPGQNNRKFLTTHFDYNITSKHHFDSVWNYQNYVANPDGVNSIYPLLPGTGTVLGHPEVGGTRRISFSIVGTLRSTLTASLTNELRYGVAPGGNSIFREEISPALFSQWKGYVPNMGYIQAPYRASSQSRRNTPVTTLSDNLTWAKSSHIFNFGGNLTSVKSWQQSVGSSVFQTVAFGVANGDPVNTGTTGIFDLVNFPNSSATNRSDAAQMYATLTGRVSSFTRSVTLDEKGNYAHIGSIDRNHMREMAFFFQDSWRAHPRLTVNYGARWDVQFPLVNENGTYTRVGLEGVWGVSGIGNMFKPGVMTGSVPVFQRVDPGTRAYNTNPKQISPSVGLAWRIPSTEKPVLSWVTGKGGNSVFRAGYAISTVREGMDYFISIWGANQGRNASLNLTPDAFPEVFGTPGSVWFRDANLPARAEPGKPAYPIPVNAGQSVNDFDPNLKMGYVQSWNIGFQRELSKSTAVEVRYVGNHAVGLWRQVNLNETNIYENGFLNEFKAAQNNLRIARGGNLLNNTNIANYGNQGMPGQVALPIITGAGVPTSDSTFATYLERGQAGTFANSIATSSARMTNLRNAGYPANFFTVNPTTVNSGAFLVINGGHSTYNSLQIEARRRMASGLLVQGSYTWSKSLTNMFASSTAGVSQPTTFRNGNLDKGPSPWDIRHGLKLNYVYELPAGRGKRFLHSGNAILQKAVEGWQVSGVSRVQSGSPFRITGRSTANQNDNGVVLYNMTASQLNDAVKIRKTTGSNGFGLVYYLPQDLIDNSMAAWEVGGKTLANLDKSKPYIGPQTDPGQFGYRVYMYSPWQARFDVSLAKVTRIAEGKSVEIRAQALNVVNSANFLLGAAANEINTGSVTASFGQTRNAYRDITVSGSSDPGGRIIEFLVRFKF